MKTGSAVAALLLLGVAVSGCLGTPGQPSGPTGNGSDGPADDGATDGNGTGGGSDDGADGNGTGDEGNETGGNGTAGNGTGEGDDGTDDPDRSWPDPADAPIRPGFEMRIQRGGETFVCTMGFVFSSPDNATLYMSTASHCVGGKSVGQPVTLNGIAGAGVVAYCSWGTIAGNGTSCPADDDDPQTVEPDNDFALIRIVDEHRDAVHPSVRHWGGPTGPAGDPAPMDHVLVTGDTWLRQPVDGIGDPLAPTDPHEGYVTDVGPWVFYAYFAPPNMGGDSGSPVLTADGEAAGIYTHVLFAEVPGTTPPASHGSVRLSKAVDFMESNTNLTVELKTWSQTDAGMLP